VIDTKRKLVTSRLWGVVTDDDVRDQEWLGL